MAMGKMEYPRIFNMKSNKAGTCSTSGVHLMILDRNQMLLSDAGQLAQSNKQALRTQGTQGVPLESGILGPSSPRATCVLEARNRNMQWVNWPLSPETISYL